MADKLTEQDYTDAARELSVEPAAIKAVARVESKGEGFDSKGRPTILFERHVFYRLTKGKYKDHPDICNKTPGGYGRKNQQYTRLAKAVTLDRDAALQSCSWGKFQIMGFHWKNLGYASLAEFVSKMQTSEAEHLDSFVRYIEFFDLAKYLREHNWEAFAAHYNGPDYKKNKYDSKMAWEYATGKQREAAKSVSYTASGITAVLGGRELSQPYVSLTPTKPTASGITSETSLYTLSGLTDLLSKQASPFEPTLSQPDLPEKSLPTAAPGTDNNPADSSIGTANTPATPPPNSKTIIAPAPEKAVKKSAWAVIASIFVPPIFAGAVDFVRQIADTVNTLVQGGYLDAREIGNAVVSSTHTALMFLFANYPYQTFLAVGFIFLILMNKALRQFFFGVEFFNLADKSTHDIQIIGQ